MTYEFEELDIGERLVLEVEWHDPSRFQIDEPTCEVVEMTFLGYDPDTPGSEVKLRSVENDTVYWVPDTCAKWEESIRTEKTCYNCGQSQSYQCGNVTDVNVPDVPEIEQQTFADISTELASDDGKSV